MSDPFSKDFSTQASYPRFNPKKVGDACRGYLVQTQERDDRFNDAQRQRVYIIEVPEGETYEATTKVAEPTVKVKAGEKMSIYGRFTRKDSDRPDLKVIDDFETVPMGTMIGVKFDKTRKNAAGKEYQNWDTFVYPEVKEGFEAEPEEPVVSEAVDNMDEVPFE